MNLLDYFLRSEYWSVPGFLVAVLFFMGYILFGKPSGKQTATMAVALLLIYLVLGSPIDHLLDFGLHSIAMFQHIMMLMILPVFLWKALPKDVGPGFFRPSAPMALMAWGVGTIAMWGGHFVEAAQLSSKTGLAICGISVSSDSWISAVPNHAILWLLLVLGMVFTAPVFHPDRSKRIAPIKAVAYLFLSCVSCSLLGLWTAFSAASSSLVEAAPLLTTLRNPIPMTLRTDQEMAGMLMWVPGCIFYVLASLEILLEWLEEETPHTEYEGGNTDQSKIGNHPIIDNEQSMTQ